MKQLVAILIVSSLSLPTLALAEVVSSSSTHFVLRHEASSALSVDELWQRLVRPETWWHPDHTYSGDSENLSLDAEAGGIWMESWEGGSVAHGTVLYVKEGEVLRMNAPFGPLQALGVYTIWTITISPDGSGSRVVFDEVSNGPPSANLAELAGAVDNVKAEAIARLARQP
jgi:hypothetical protein